MQDLTEAPPVEFEPLVLDDPAWWDPRPVSFMGDAMTARSVPTFQVRHAPSPI